MIAPRQQRALLEVIGEANGAADPAEFRASIVLGARRLVPADYCTYNEVGADGSVRAAIADPEVTVGDHATWARLAGQNPLVQRYQRTRDGRPYRFSDVIDREELEALELYRELYAPMGVRHQIALALPSTRSLTIGIALSRGSRDFSDGERELLALVRPHLIQAYRNVVQRARAASLLEAIETGLDEHGVAAVVLDGDDTIELATAQARRLLGDLEEGEPFPATAGGEGLLLHRTARSDGGSVVFVERAARVLTPVVLEDLGLTPAEARVLAALAAGNSTADAARRLSLSPRTVLKHSERIHRKLGVRDRAQAVATAWAATEAEA